MTESREAAVARLMKVLDEKGYLIAQSTKPGDMSYQLRCRCTFTMSAANVQLFVAPYNAHVRTAHAKDPRPIKPFPESAGPGEVLWKPEGLARVRARAGTPRARYACGGVLDARDLRTSARHILG